MPVNQTLKLSTGQTLGYLEMGDPQGPACFFFHGFPGSSKQVQVIRNLQSLGRFRVIAIDRPGFGQSTYRANRKNTEIAGLIRELADHLHIEKFHLISVSGGTPPAMIVGDRLRARVLSLTSICGLGPLHDRKVLGQMGSIAQWLMRIGRVSTFFSAAILARSQSQMQKGSLSRERLAKLLPEPDVAILLNSELHGILSESMAHAFLQGPGGPATELRVMQQDWAIKDWNFPFPVSFWHGELDTIVPPAHSRQLAARIPGAQLHMVPNEAHYSLPILRIEEILAPVLATLKI